MVIQSGRLRLVSQLWSRRRRLSVVRGLLVGIAQFEQRRFREQSTHKLDPHRQPIGGEARWHAHCWKAEDRGETPVVARVCQIRKRWVGQSVRANHGWWVIESGIYQRVETILRHQLQHDLPGLFSQ